MSRRKNRKRSNKHSRQRISSSSASVLKLVNLSQLPDVEEAQALPEVKNNTMDQRLSSQVPPSYSQMLLAISPQPIFPVDEGQMPTGVENLMEKDKDTNWPVLGVGRDKREPAFRVAGMSVSTEQQQGQGPFSPMEEDIFVDSVWGGGGDGPAMGYGGRARNSDSLSSCTSTELPGGTALAVGGRVGIYVPPPLRNRKAMPLSLEGLEGIPGFARISQKPVAMVPPLVKEPLVTFHFSSWTPWDSPNFMEEMREAIRMEEVAQVQVKELDPEPEVVSVSASPLYDSFEELVPVTSSPPPPLPTPPPAVAAAPEPFSYSSALKTPSMAPPPQPPQTKISPSSCPIIVVNPLRSVNFTGVPIQFSVILEKAGVSLKPEQFEIVAMPPSGRPILQCNIQRKGECKNAMQVFFLATAEVGWYTIKIKCHWKAKKEVTSLVRLLVSRNYFRESVKPDALIQFQLRFLERGDLDADNLWGLACDRTTNKLYYTESSSNGITCIDPTTGGKIIFRGQGSLDKPTGLCCDERHRRLAVCERGKHRVVFLDLDSGQYLTAFGSKGEGNGQFTCPWNIAISPCGTQFCVSDLGNHRLQVFDLNGKYICQFPLQNPAGVAFGLKGELFAANWYHNTVTELISGRVWKTGGGRDLKHPQGLVIDSIGSLLVADKGNNCVRHFTTGEVKEGEESQLSVIHKVDGVVLEEPVNVAVMGDGRIAILESTGRITVF